MNTGPPFADKIGEVKPTAEEAGRLIEASGFRDLNKKNDETCRHPHPSLVGGALATRAYRLPVPFRFPAVSQDEEGVKAAEGIVNALKLGVFDCRRFENPALQR